MYGVYKRDGIVTEEAAKKIVDQRLEMQEGKTCDAIAYMLEGNLTLTPGARKYFALHGYVGLRKMAIVTTSKLKATIANIYILVDKPVKPTRLFADTVSALKWLNE